MADMQPSVTDAVDTPADERPAEHPDSPAASRDRAASETASDFIDSQLRLEADAKEALPYSFDHCTQPLGPLRQSLFACLTCNPPRPSSSSSTEPDQAAGICYSCSIACHGDHTLVELFNRRNFVCDCGTTRLPATSPCTLRINPETGLKGPVHSQEPAVGNTYNHNFRNRFCACEDWYVAEEEKGTMFQCLGLATEAEGGCGEDWWHPECVVWGPKEGARRRQGARAQRQAKSKNGDAVGSAAEPGNGAMNANGGQAHNEHGADEDTLPEGFPAEDSFETFICYKCVDTQTWLKQYAGTEGFLQAVYVRDETSAPPTARQPKSENENENGASTTAAPDSTKKDDMEDKPPTSLKRSHEADADEDEDAHSIKRTKTASPPSSTLPQSPTKHTLLPPPHAARARRRLSLFCTSSFRTHLCRCATCYPHLRPHPQLLDEEDTYEAPMSPPSSAAGSSLLDRGTAALSGIDRVRALEGVMAYNDLRDKVKAFLKPYAESGEAVSAEDVKSYFAKLRGDDDNGGGGGGGDVATADAEK